MSHYLDHSNLFVNFENSKSNCLYLNNAIIIVINFAEWIEHHRKRNVSWHFLRLASNWESTLSISPIDQALALRVLFRFALICRKFAFYVARGHP